MASLINLITFCSLLSIYAASAAQTQLKTKASILQVTKDPKTLQYITQIQQRTPPVTLSLTVDLAGESVWTDCIHPYVSSSYHFHDCHTPQCKFSKINLFCGNCYFPPALGGCKSDACTTISYNPIGNVGLIGELTTDLISFQSNGGKNSMTRHVSVPEFHSVCLNSSFLNMLEDLAHGVTGMAGFGRTGLSLPSQLATFFKYPNIFGLCLSTSKGAIFLGDGPYDLQPNKNAASSLTYTPLLSNNGPYNGDSGYFIGIKSIKINGHVVPLNASLLSIDEEGNGGTIISTTSPYTALEPSIYNAFVKSFTKAMSNFTRVASVAPFEACYSSKNIASTRVGPAVPVIDLVLQSEEVYWRIYGANSMVQVKKDVLCLGFVKRKFPIREHSITIGGHQLENNLLQFNVAKSTLGFSSSLLSRQTTCANFN